MADETGRIVRLRVPGTLHARAVAAAEREGTALPEFLRQAIRAACDKAEQQAARRERLAWQRGGLRS